MTKIIIKYGYILGLITLMCITCLTNANAKKLDPVKKVEIKNGVINVNGKPFFVIGITMAAHYHKALKESGEAGFNCVQTSAYDSSDPLSFRQDVRDAYENGMYSSLSFNGLETDLEALKRVVNACKDEPGLLVWELPDEPNIRTPEPADKPYLERPYRFPPSQLKAMYDAIKSIDNKHPIWVNLAHGIPSDHKDYNPSVDIMCADVYPVPEVAFGAQAYYSDVTVAQCLGKPAWQYIQMAPVRPQWKEKDRAPTIEEARCLTYMAIAHSITGVMYFSFEADSWRINKSDPDYWAKWPGLISELKSLSGFLLVPDAAQKVVVKQTLGSEKGPWDYPALHIALRKFKNEYLLIAVNGLDEKVSADLNLPRSVSKRGVVISENRKIILDDNMLKDIWEPHAVHIYRFK